MKLKCQRCKHEWEYKGKNKWFTSCPKCKTSVKIKEYHYLNKNCPICDKPIGGYFYTIKNKVKYHTECLKNGTKKHRRRK